MKRKKQSPVIIGIFLIAAIFLVSILVLNPFTGLVGKVVSDVYTDKQPYKIFGKVMTKDEMPLKEVSIELSNQDFIESVAHTKTNSDGLYLFGGENGKLILTYSKPGYNTFEYKIRYYGGQREIVLIMFEDD